MRKWLCLLLIGLLMPLPGRGEGSGVSVSAPEGTVRPWESALILYTLPEAGLVDLYLTDETGENRFTVARDVNGIAGQNSIFWNGTHLHQPAPEGTWRLILETQGETAETRITIGAAEPTGTPEAGAAAPETTPDPREPLAEETENPLTELEEPEETEESPEGQAPRTMEAEPPAAEVIAKEDAEPLRLLFTPATGSPYDGQDTSLNYWTLPMDIRNEAEIWQVLTAPITVVVNGKGEKSQVPVRTAPDAESEGVGVVTCETQGVHVLERGKEWSLIECYSSSFHNSSVLNWNTLIQGYVPTEYLQEIVPNQEMGLVVDKLTQRLYVFREGKLFSTLMVSTGLSNSRQPYNETRSGEFLLTSKVGTFSSGNLRCGKAIRFNGGDLLHEVPYTQSEDGSTSYAICEPKLGAKASHGCIRVQRKPTPEGVNMAWFWENLKRNSQTRMLIWEDWQGRQIEIPRDDLQLYYNPEGGRQYHSGPTCPSAVGRTFTAFSYSELDTGSFAKLNRCEYCAPALRRAEIEKINETYAFGGDHDPVMTKARKKCPRTQRK